MEETEGNGHSSPLGYKTITYTVVVKKCLQGALKKDLPQSMRQHFLNMVDDMTET